MEGLGQLVAVHQHLRPQQRRNFEEIHHPTAGLARRLLRWALLHCSRGGLCGDGLLQISCRHNRLNLPPKQGNPFLQMLLRARSVWTWQLVLQINFPAVTVCGQNRVHCGNLRDVVTRCETNVTHCGTE